MKAYVNSATKEVWRLLVSDDTILPKRNSCLNEGLPYLQLGTL